MIETFIEAAKRALFHFVASLLEWALANAFIELEDTLVDIRARLFYLNEHLPYVN